MKRGQSKLQPFQSKPRMAADGSIIPTSVTVGSTQKRGSVTVAHGLSFTEVSFCSGCMHLSAGTSCRRTVPFPAQLTLHERSGGVVVPTAST